MREEMIHTLLPLAAGLPNPKHAASQSWFVPFLLGIVVTLVADLVLRHRPWR